MKKVLVFGGKTGWIGGLMCEMLAKEGTVMLVGETVGTLVLCRILSSGRRKQYTANTNLSHPRFCFLFWICLHFLTLCNRFGFILNLNLDSFFVGPNN